VPVRLKTSSAPVVDMSFPTQRAVSPLITHDRRKLRWWNAAAASGFALHGA
jgi:hypothetical protein